MNTNEAKSKLSPDLLNFLNNSEPKPAKISLIIKTKDGPKPEDEKLVYSHQGVIEEQFPFCNTYAAKLPADIAVIEEVAQDERVICIARNPSIGESINIRLVTCFSMYIIALKDLTDEEMMTIQKNGGLILQKLQNSPCPFYAALLTYSIATELEKNNPELRIVRNIDRIDDTKCESLFDFLGEVNKLWETDKMQKP